MDIVQELAPIMRPYISITGASGSYYTYKKKFGERRFPAVEIRMRTAKGSFGAMLYIAVEAGSDLSNLAPGQKLYVGSSSAKDRMFRGDGFDGKNFHHEQMRTGNKDRNLERHIALGGQVDVYAASAAQLATLADTSERFKGMLPMARGEVALSRGRNHAGYWFEQLILRDQGSDWAWNSQGAHADAAAQLRARGL